MSHLWSLSWHAKINKVHKLHQKYILCMYHVFTGMPGENYRRQLGSLCDIF